MQGEVSMNQQEATKRRRERTPNNRTTTGYRISDELWEVVQPLLPTHVNTHRFGGGRPRVPDRDCADAIFMCCERTASGKPSTRPSYVRIRRRMIDFKSGWKQECFSSCGKLELNSLMSYVGLTGSGSRWTGRCGIRAVGWGKNRVQSYRPWQERGETQPARPMGMEPQSAWRLTGRNAMT